MSRTKVTDPDSFCATVFKKRFHGFIGRNCFIKFGGHWLMHKIEVHIVCSKATKTCIESSLCFVFSVVTNPKFRNDKNFGAIYAGLLEAFSDLLFVHVRSRRINEAITCLQSSRNSFKCLFWWALEYAQTESRYE